MSSSLKELTQNPLILQTIKSNIPEGFLEQISYYQKLIEENFQDLFSSEQIFDLIEYFIPKEILDSISIHAKNLKNSNNKEIFEYAFLQVVQNVFGLNLTSQLNQIIVKKSIEFLWNNKDSIYQNGQEAYEKIKNLIFSLKSNPFVNQSINWEEMEKNLEFIFSKEDEGFQIFDFYNKEECVELESELNELMNQNQEEKEEFFDHIIDQDLLQDALEEDLFEDALQEMEVKKEEEKKDSKSFEDAFNEFNSSNTKEEKQNSYFSYISSSVCNFARWIIS